MVVKRARAVPIAVTLGLYFAIACVMYYVVSDEHLSINPLAAHTLHLSLANPLGLSLLISFPANDTSTVVPEAPRRCIDMLVGTGCFVEGLLKLKDRPSSFSDKLQPVLGTSFPTTDFGRIFRMNLDNSNLSLSSRT